MFDLGYGFGKIFFYNYMLVKYLFKIMVLGYFVLVGMFRKFMIGSLFDRKVEECLVGSVVFVIIVVIMWVYIICVYDV